MEHADIRGRRRPLRRRGGDGELGVDPDVCRGRRRNADAFGELELRGLERLGMELVELRQFGLQFRLIVEQQFAQQQLAQQQLAQQRRKHFGRRRRRRVVS
jgi:hypothetical protein